MNLKADAMLMLSQCYTCYGCNRLEDPYFKGDKKCKYYRKAEKEVLSNRKWTTSKGQRK
jgi:hypothetical protein